MFFTQTVIVVFYVDGCIISDGDHSFTRIAVNISKGANLSHIEVSKSSEFVEHAVSGIVDTLVAADEASVEAPFATTWVHLTTTYQNLQLSFVEAKDDTVYRQPDFRMFTIKSGHFIQY